MMKKLLVILVLLVLSLSSCSDKPSEEETKTIQIETTFPINFPADKPELVITNPAEDYCNEDEVFFKRSFRWVYYGLPAFISDLVGDKGYEYSDKILYEYDPDTGPQEMPLAKFVEKFNIPKGNFIELYESRRIRWTQTGRDMQKEEYELPNPDIIYTFDNEVINAYYRRENPVAPDWSQVKTYESYAEYQKAKG